MIGSSLYFIALLATAELEIAENPTPNNATNAQDQTTEITKPAEEKTINSVTITNGIEPSMLSYKHWTGTYSPDVFTVYINDTTIEPGQTYTLADSKTPIVIRCDYSFMNGIRKGTKTTTYTMNDQITTAIVTFSWLDTHKILLDNATLSLEAI